MIQPTTKITKPRLTAVEALDTSVDSRNAKELIASCSKKRRTDK